MKKLLFLLVFIPLVSFSQTFCDGWEAGYEKGLESCMKMGLAPTCPIPKMLADTYGDGYGLGYKKAKEKCKMRIRLQVQEHIQILKFICQKKKVHL